MEVYHKEDTCQKKHHKLWTGHSKHVEEDARVRWEKYQVFANGSVESEHTIPTVKTNVVAAS